MKVNFRYLWVTQIEYNLIIHCNIRRALGSNLECAYSMPMLVLTPFFLHQGAFTAFFLGVYPTSFSFDDNLESGGRLVAYFCIGIGIGEIIGIKNLIIFVFLFFFLIFC